MAPQVQPEGRGTGHGAGGAAEAPAPGGARLAPTVYGRAARILVVLGKSSSRQHWRRL